DSSLAASGLYIGSPSLAVLTNGQYIASHDEFGPNSTEFTRPVPQIFTSSDRGQTWQKRSTVQGAFWSTLFVHRGVLYLLGTDRHHGNVVIRRSIDNGQTWPPPPANRTGLRAATGESHRG